MWSKCTTPPEVEGWYLCRYNGDAPSVWRYWDGYSWFGTERQSSLEDSYGYFAERYDPTGDASRRVLSRFGSRGYTHEDTWFMPDATGLFGEPLTQSIGGL